MILIIATLIASCASIPKEGPARTNKLFKFEQTNSLTPRHGVLIMSAGRVREPCDKCNANSWGILPFVSYHILSTQEDGSFKKVAFIRAENGLFNQIGQQNYGFIHLRELPAGSYIITGIESRGRDTMFAANGMFVSILDSNDETGISFEFEIEEGKVNYIGQLLTTNGNLINSSIAISHHPERDLEFAYETYPTLKQYEVVTSVLKKSDKTIQTTPINIKP